MVSLTNRKRKIIAHDADWQFPAITEKHAFIQAKKYLWDVDGIYYLAFPWATLIDQLNTNIMSGQRLIDKLSALTRNIEPNARVVTVCQHIHMLKFKDIFFDHNITDIFWTHAVKGQNKIVEEREINIYPFPLFPVQFETRCQEADNKDRQHLFSFIGARANQWYLTESRNWILDILGNDDRGLVVGRDQWHYNSIVYDHQIRKNKTSTKNLIDETASNQFREVLKQTTFSLCPSGSGPNSIRLWESIGAGSIPVILADSYAPPGPEALWKEAAVFCKETLEDIKALPELLEKLATDETLLTHKRKMLAQIWTLYGPDTFIYDIQKLYIDLANNQQINFSKATDAARPTSKLSMLAETIVNMPYVKEEDLDFFLTACTTRALTNKYDFADQVLLCSTTQALLDFASIQDTKSAALKKLEAIYDVVMDEEFYIPSNLSLVGNIKSNTKAYLHGPHSNRTPMAYDVYQPHFLESVDFVSSPNPATLIVTGFNIDLTDEIPNSLARRLDEERLKVAVVSEEPLWDSVWSKGYQRQNRTVKVSGKTVNYEFYNHMNSDIFDFDNVPYFITTQDDYFIRYSNMFRRNSELSADEILTNWRLAKFNYAFFAENRIDERYEVSFPDDEVFGLSSFRTKLATQMSRGNVLRVGAGWDNTSEKRQALPDWHLDKLSALDKNAMIVSGLENTHQINYVTEKIFDAYATLAIPLYYASSSHYIHSIIPNGSFINLFGKSAEEAVKFVENFEPTPRFIDNYIASQKSLANLFSSVDTLIEERKRVVKAITSLLKIPQ